MEVIDSVIFVIKDIARDSVIYFVESGMFETGLFWIAMFFLSVEILSELSYHFYEKKESERRVAERQEAIAIKLKIDTTPETSVGHINLKPLLHKQRLNNSKKHGGFGMMSRTLKKKNSRNIERLPALDGDLLMNNWRRKHEQKFN